MYIAQLHIVGFRCFRDTSISFEPNVTVIVGENNAGKTSLLKAIGLVLDRASRAHPTMEDFSRPLGTEKPPRITVTLTLRSSHDDTQADRALVSTWLTKLAPTWEAKLTYEFFLPVDVEESFARALGESPTQEKCAFVLDSFLPQYLAKIWAGDPMDQRRAEPDLLQKIDFQRLDALRDVDTEMFRGKGSLLRTVLSDILDRDAASDAVRLERRQAFQSESKALVRRLLSRLDDNKLFALVKETGANDGGQPQLGGDLGEADVLAALELLLEKHGFAIPASHNGLGYNNLIYIALVLANIELAASSKHGQNAHVFPFLVIEEPEAHLHPSMQYKLMRYLKKRLEERKSSRQIFVTSHSTHVTAATRLDSLVCLSFDGAGIVHVAYPGKAFPATAAGQESKEYVQRYLDATKSTMLFAKAVIFVEGIAETLLLPAFGEVLGASLEEHHIAVVPVGGLTFKHFLPLFGCVADDTSRASGLHRRVACIVDADPMRKPKEPNGRWSSCYHYELDRNPTAFEYRSSSFIVASLSELKTHNHLLLISSGTQTLEYDVALENMNSPLMASTDCIEEADGGENTPFRLPSLAPDLEAAIEVAVLPRYTAEQLRFATRYLESVSAAKGVAALMLDRRLRGNLRLDPGRRIPFHVPPYVADAIRWVCNTGAPSS